MEKEPQDNTVDCLLSSAEDFKYKAVSIIYWTVYDTSEPSCVAALHTSCKRSFSILPQWMSVYPPSSVVEGWFNVYLYSAGCYEKKKGLGCFISLGIKSYWSREGKGATSPVSPLVYFPEKVLLMCVPDELLEIKVEAFFFFFFAFFGGCKME